MSLCVKCPVCGENTFWDHVSQEFCGTADCHCGALLYIENRAAKEFNAHMHELDSNWPFDGENTFYVEVEE